MKKITLKILPFVLPFLTFAQVNKTETIPTILGKTASILRQIIPILLIIATVIFIWGLIWYILSVGKEESRKEARNIMIWGIVILFVIVAMWGLVSVLGTTFNIENANIPIGPQ